MNAGRTALVAVVALALGAGGATWAILSHDTRVEHPVPTGSVREGAAALVPIGDAAGATTLAFPADMDNPLGSGPGVVEAGRKLFGAMNCAGCHGYTGGGGMGPNLTDNYWRYGGTPVRIYKTLYEGRPQGMPAWGRALPPRDLWALTAFVGSLGAGVPAKDYQRDLQGDYHGPGSKQSDGEAARGGTGTDDQ